MVYWDWISVTFYITLGCIGSLCIKKVKKRELYSNHQISINNQWCIIWFLSWFLATVFRVVDVNIGGSDAINYVRYFQNCLEPLSNQNQYAVRADFGFRYICKCIRLFTSNYHIFFAIIYGIIICSIILLFNEFSFSSVNAIPYILIFYIHLLGFSSIRTSLSMAFLFIAIVFLKRKKSLECVIMCILSIITHKASILYASSLLFYKLFSRIKIKTRDIIIWMLATFVIGRMFQVFFLKFGNYLFDSEVYVKYIRSSVGVSFFQDFWKLALGQIMLLIMYLIFYKRVEVDMNQGNEEDKKRYKMIKLFSIFDFMMISVCFLLNIWRGYQYFFFFRLMLWAEIFNIILKFFSKNSRRFVKYIFIIFVIIYLIFRISTMYDKSCLLPYKFNPFNHI